MSVSFRYQAGVLKNGLRVLTVPVTGWDSVAVAIWVATGSRYETSRQAGVSHFLEHMLFKGTPSRTGRQIRLAIEGVGGVLNAFTGEEATCYFAKLLSRHLQVGMEVLSDMVRNASLASGEVAKEKPVILEEIKMYRDLPGHYVQEMMGEMLWPRQPLGRPISGTLESVAALRPRDLRDYKTRHYHPKNILVSVAGPVHHGEILKRVSDFFEDDRPQRPAVFEKAAAHRRGPQARFVEKQIEQTHFVMGFEAFSKFHPDRYKLGLLNVILGANMSSRLFEELREKRGLAYDIRSGVGFYRDTGSFTLSAGVENKKAHHAVAVILSQLRKLCKRGVREGELRRAKDYFMSQFLMALEDSLDHLLWAGERLLDTGTVPDHREIVEEVEKVRPEDIREVARKIFKSRNLHLALTGPLSQPECEKIKRDFYLD